MRSWLRLGPSLPSRSGVGIAVAKPSANRRCPPDPFSVRALAGTSSVPASSDQTQRHRLNRGGTASSTERCIWGLSFSWWPSFRQGHARPRSPTSSLARRARTGTSHLLSEAQARRCSVPDRHARPGRRLGPDEIGAHVWSSSPVADSVRSCRYSTAWLGLFSRTYSPARCSAMIWGLDSWSSDRR